MDISNEIQVQIPVKRLLGPLCFEQWIQNKLENIEYNMMVMVWASEEPGH